jgi:hypothetical protein
MEAALESGVKIGRSPEADKTPQRLGRLITSPKAYAKRKSLLAGLRWLRANLTLARVVVAPEFSVHRPPGISTASSTLRVSARL